jgi:hypothetical protein
MYTFYNNEENRIEEVEEPDASNQRVGGRLYYELYGFLKGKTCQGFSISTNQPLTS